VNAIQGLQNVSLGGRVLRLGRPHHNTNPTVAQGIPNVSVVPKPTAVLVPAQPQTANNRIYIGSIFWDINSHDIKTIFESFGPIKAVSLMPNPETGKHKGYGFVEFVNPQSATAALELMEGFTIMGRPIKVGRATSQASAYTILPVTPNNNNVWTSAAETTNSNVSSNMLAMLTNPTHAQTITAVADNIANLIKQRKQKESKETLSNEEELTITSVTQRYEIMQRLARGTAASRCVILRNMVSYSDTLDQGLQSEISEECSKYGELERVVIFQEHDDTKGDKNDDNTTVKIFILYNNFTGSQMAVKALNGRYFAGKQIQAQYYDENQFSSGN